MSIPAPAPGLVIRHSFLWSHEDARGRREGSKARPCAIIVAARREGNGAIQVTLAPITHAPGDDHAASLKLPPEICRKLGLDDDRQWLRFDELNRFEWPGYDLSPIPGKGNTFVYGTLPPTFFKTAKDAIYARAAQKKIKAVIDRDV